MKGITENFSWRNATIFAKASTYAYRDLSEFKREFGSDDGAEVRFYDVAGTQAYSWIEGNNLCFVFRGTEPTQWADKGEGCGDLIIKCLLSIKGILL